MSSKDLKFQFSRHKLPDILLAIELRCTRRHCRSNISPGDLKFLGAVPPPRLGNEQKTVQLKGTPTILAGASQSPKSARGRLFIYNGSRVIVGELVPRRRFVPIQLLRVAEVCIDPGTGSGKSVCVFNSNADFKPKRFCISLATR